MQLLLAAFLDLVAQVQPLPTTPIGHWINPRGTVIVEIVECGEGALCGSVRWASENAAADAGAAGTETLVGMELFRHFTAKRDARWAGKIFVPDLRRTHSAELSLNGHGQLRVSGCMAARLVCKSQIWTRAEAPNTATK